MPLLFFVTGPFFMASVIGALLKYDDEELKHPWRSLLVRVFIFFFIIILIIVFLFPLL